MATHIFLESKCLGKHTLAQSSILPQDLACPDNISLTLQLL